MQKIKNIIVATDFSLTATNAYRYANAFANTLGAKIAIVHIKETLIIVSDVVTSPLVNDNDSDLIKDIEEIVAEENNATGNKMTAGNDVKIKILTGDPAAVLTELSKNNQTDLIIIGTTGLSDVLTKLFGSVSIKVSNKAYCPVILVPRDAKWQPIKQIMFASNYDSITKPLVEQIIRFASMIDAGIHFVNVQNANAPLEIKEKTDWNELIVEIEPGLSVEKHTIYGSNTIEELQKYSKEKNINMIAFVSKHRNFWQSLVHKSTTKNMAISTSLPLLVIHSDDEDEYTQ